MSTRLLMESKAWRVSAKKTNNTIVQYILLMLYQWMTKVSPAEYLQAYQDPVTNVEVH